MRSVATDTTALGVAIAAGQAKGVELCDLKLENRQYCINLQHDTFLPTTTDTERNRRYAKWKMAVERSLGWAVSKKSQTMTEERYRLLASIPAGVFFFTSFLFLAVSQSMCSSA